MRSAFVARLAELASRDPAIFLITGDLGFGVLTEFGSRFPSQYLNAGVAEQNMLGVATGLALEGRTVFVYSLGNFPTLRCLEQIRNDACYHQANVKIVAVGGGFSYGQLGVSHHATEDLAILRAMPAMTVVAPGDRWESAQATSAIARTAGTCYLRLDRAAADNHGSADDVFEIGKARVVREGTDVTVIAAGGTVAVAVAAADRLEHSGIRCRVVSMHTVKPLDVAAVRSACHETGAVITIEEHTIDGGLGSAVAEVCLDGGIVPRVFRRIGLRAGFSSIVGSQDYLREQYGVSESALIGTIRSIVRTGEGSTALERLA